MIRALSFAVDFSQRMNVLDIFFLFNNKISLQSINRILYAPLYLELDPEYSGGTCNSTLSNHLTIYDYLSSFVNKILNRPVL